MKTCNKIIENLEKFQLDLLARELYLKPFPQKLIPNESYLDFDTAIIHRGS